MIRLCVQCGEKPARKGRPRCSRCEKFGAGAKRPKSLFVHGRPERLAWTGQRIHDEKKIMVQPDGTVTAVPKDLLLRCYLSSCPGDERWLMVWKVA